MHILNVGQVFDLEHHSGLVNQFSVRLADGTVMIISTDENTVTQLLEAAAHELRGSHAGPSGPETEVAQADSPEGLGGTTFGGEAPDPGEGLEPPEPPVMGTMEEPPPLPTDKLGKPIKRGVDGRGALGKGHPNKKGRVDLYRTVDAVPARTVPHDEAGNPIVPQTQGTTSPHDPGTDDEDGTSI